MERKPLARPFILTRKSEKPENCKHNWQTYKKTGTIDSKGHTQVFIIRGCPNCRKKIVIDMRLV